MSTCTEVWKAKCPTSAQQCSKYKKNGTKTACIDAYCKGQNPTDEGKRDECNKRMNYTSEPIPDYIMRALKPKKSVHPEYGKLRY